MSDPITAETLAEFRQYANAGAHEVAEDLRIAGLMVQSANRETLERRAGVTSRLVYAVPALLAEVERLTAERDYADGRATHKSDLAAQNLHRAEKAEAEVRRLRTRRAGLHYALDGDDEPTIWRGDDAILRRCVAPEAFDVLAGLLGGGGE